MIATNLVNRPTKDVDVVAMLDSNEKIVEALPLPETLLQAASSVASAMNLPANWLNNGPRRLLIHGFRITVCLKGFCKDSSCGLMEQT